VNQERISRSSANQQIVNDQNMNRQIAVAQGENLFKRASECFTAETKRISQTA
jgi:hypothetical protein